MSHLTEEDLIVHYYGESADPFALESHLDGCLECRAAYGSLKRILNVIDAMPVPERGAGYEEAVWRRLRGAGLRPALWRKPLRHWPVIAAALACLAAAVVLIPRPAPQRPMSRNTAETAGMQDRILRLAIGDYLDRSEIVLTELKNDSSPAPVDIASEQQRAADLLAGCRLYRQTALRAGDQAVAGVLDDLERVLVEIAHSPSRLARAQLEELRQRLRSAGALHRIRALSSIVRREDEPKL